MTTIYPQLLDLSVKYTVDHIPVYSHKRKGIVSAKLPLNWEYITIHNSNNENSTAISERLSLVSPRNTSKSSSHLVIDNIQCIECVPLNERVVGCEDDLISYGNSKSIHITLCEDGNIEKTIENVAEVIAILLLLKNKTTNEVKQHGDWTGKNCPRLLRKDNNRLYNLLLSTINTKMQLLSFPQIAYQTIKLPTNATLINSVFYFPLSTLVKNINGSLTSLTEEYKEVALVKLKDTNQSEKSLLFTLNETNVVLRYGERVQVHTMDVPVLMKDDEFIVPLKFVLDLCKISIKSFNGKTIVFIKDNKQFSISAGTDRLLVRNR